MRLSIAPLSFAGKDNEWMDRCMKSFECLASIVANRSARTATCRCLAIPLPLAQFSLPVLSVRYNFKNIMMWQRDLMLEAGASWLLQMSIGYWTRVSIFKETLKHQTTKTEIVCPVGFRTLFSLLRRCTVLKLLEAGWIWQNCPVCRAWVSTTTPLVIGMPQKGHGLPTSGDRPRAIAAPHCTTLYLWLAAFSKL